MVYFIKVVAFQLLFLLSYDLFLKKETFFNWNRIYLIFSSLIAFVLPFIKLESFQNVVPQEYIILLPEIVLTPEKAVATIEPTWNWFLIVGIAVSSLLFIYKIVQLVKLRFKGRFVKKEHYTIVIIPKSTLAFSIFKYVFIGEEIQENKLEDILSHELVHIREKHSLDLLYFELLRIMCWFNPLIYIYQKRISEVHEYIADAAVVKHKNKSDYYEKLLAEVFQTQQFSFANQFFKHSLIKKRIIMLTKQKSREIFKLKYLVLVPMLILSLVYTSCEDTTVSEVENTEASVEKMNAKVAQAVEDFNAYSESVKGVEMMTKEQYTKLGDLSKQLFESRRELAIAKGEEPEVLHTNAWNYDDYVVARKKSIQENVTYSEFETEAVSSKELDKVPVHPNCEGKVSQNELKECLNFSIQKHISQNFDVKLAESIGLVGRQRIVIKFVIDTNGNVANVLARAPHPALKDEAEKTINSLPKFKPGMKDGKPKSVKFAIPIVFQIQE